MSLVASGILWLHQGLDSVGLYQGSCEATYLKLVNVTNL